MEECRGDVERLLATNGQPYRVDVVLDVLLACLQKELAVRIGKGIAEFRRTDSG